MATENADMTTEWSQFLGPSGTERLQARGVDVEWAETTTSSAPTVASGYLLKKGAAIEFTTAANQWIWTRIAKRVAGSRIVKG